MTYYTIRAPRTDSRAGGEEGGEARMKKARTAILLVAALLCLASLVPLLKLRARGGRDGAASPELAGDPAAAEIQAAAETPPPYVHTAALTAADMHTADGGTEPDGEIVNELPIFRFTGGWGVQAWVYQDTTVTVEDCYGNIVLQDSRAEWKKHGNTTLRVAKCSYRFKLSEDVDLFGLGEAHNFILLANDFDRTMLRNKLVFDFAAELGLPYTSRSCFAEVYVDGVYRGCFLLVEPVQAGSERVDVNPAQHEYLLEINPRDYYQFITPYYEYSLVIKEPKSPAEYEQHWLTDFFAEAEAAIASGDRARIEDVLDMDSFLNSYLVYELFKNSDTNRFSTYFFIQDGKLYSGPVWDFDLSSGNIELDRSAEGWVVQDGWWATLREYDWVREAWAARLAEAQELIVNLYRDNELGPCRIDALAASARAGIDRNYQIWNMRQRSYNIEIFPYNTYEENLDYLRQWLAARNTWMLSELAPEGAEELIRAAALEGGDAA